MCGRLDGFQNGIRAFSAVVLSSLVSNISFQKILLHGVFLTVQTDIKRYQFLLHKIKE